jgi:hypothetical protein
MNIGTDKPSWQVPLGLWAGLFLVFLLLSLPDLWSAEIVARGYGWHPRLIIFAPWFFCAVTGVSLYASVKRGRIGEKIGGPLLLNLGIITMFAYDAMTSLSQFGH